MLISPHRDEIREEVDIGFREWFAKRSADRVRIALDQLAKHEENPAQESLEAARHAISRIMADWSPSDCEAVSAAAAAWLATPAPNQATRLKEVLQSWKIPAVEFSWTDVGGTSMIARYINARFEDTPDGIGIDVVFGGGTDVFLRFASQGILQRIQLPPDLLKGRIRGELNGIPLYDAEHRWFGPVLSSFGILCNREVLRRINRPEPRAWQDLGKPEMFGWVSSGDPRMAGSIHMVYEIVLQGMGWDKGFCLLLRMGANTHTFIRDSGTLTRTVSGGEVAAAGNLDANALSAVGRDPTMMAFNLPEGATIINPDAMAMLRGAPRPELARLFFEYTLSDEGQLLYLLLPGVPGGPKRFPLCRLSVVEKLYEKHPPEVRSVGSANPFLVKNTISYDSKLGNARWDAVNDLIGSTIMDAHSELTASWSAVLTLPAGSARDHLESELFSPFVTEAEVRQHARSIVEDGPRARVRTVNEWGERARAHYREVRRKARK